MKIQKYTLCGYGAWWVLRYSYTHPYPLILVDNYPSLYPYTVLILRVFTLPVVGTFCGNPLNMCKIVIYSRNHYFIIH